MIIDKSGKQINIDDLEKINDIGDINLKNNDIAGNIFFEPELDGYYKEINLNHNLPKDKVILSDKPVIKLAINLYKRLLLKLVYPCISLMIAIQNHFNSNIVKILNKLRERIEISDNYIREELKEKAAKLEEKLNKIDAKHLENNHFRYTEIKNIEHFFHNELLNLRIEIGNIVYSFLHLWNLVNEQEQKMNNLTRAANEIRKEQQETIKNLVKQMNEIKKEDELRVSNLANEIRKEQQETIKNLVKQMNEIKNDLGTKLMDFYNSISKLKKVLLTSDVSLYKESIKAKEAAVLDRASQFDYIYFDLEESLRGNEADIALRQSIYLDYLKNKEPVIDIGCGRGEMLELLSQNGIKAIGIDNNTLMVNYCKKKGLQVEKDDALNFLLKVEKGSLGAIFVSHLIEHLDPDNLLHFLLLSMEKLSNNGVIILETPNAVGLYTLGQSFYLDITHIKPIHPLTLKLILEAIGFKILRLQYLSDWDKSIQLKDLPSDSGGLNKEILEVIRDNFNRLNEIIFSPRDYCIIAQK